MTKLELRNKLQKIGANMANVPEDIFEQMEKYGLKTDEDKFRFLANCLNETGGFKVDLLLYFHQHSVQSIIQMNIYGIL